MRGKKEEVSTYGQALECGRGRFSHARRDHTARGAAAATPWGEPGGDGKPESTKSARRAPKNRFPSAAPAQRASPRWQQHRPVKERRAVCRRDKYGRIKADGVQGEEGEAPEARVCPPPFGPTSVRLAGCTRGTTVGPAVRPQWPDGRSTERGWRGGGGRNRKVEHETARAERSYTK